MEFISNVAALWELHFIDIFSLENSSGIEQLIESTEYEAVFDKSRQFKTKTFFFKGSNWNDLSDKRNVCLGTQSSIDRLSWLLEIIEVWSGPISIALFAPDIEFHITSAYIEYLKKCDPRIDRQVSFHITFPALHTIRESNIVKSTVSSKTPCADPKRILKQLMAVRSKEMMNWRETLKYPQNLLRNLAKSGCQTNYTFISDIDIIPIPQLDLALDIFFSSANHAKCDKCAFIVPTYEISVNASHLPRNKTELTEFVGKSLARQYHVDFFETGQKFSNLKKWLEIPLSDEMEIAYKVEEYAFGYEPLYVSNGDTPSFDERLIGYGFARSTQVYEMYVAGYKFYLLNNAFNNHLEFQYLKTWPSWRKEQQELNFYICHAIVKELIAKYGMDPYNMTHKLNQKNIKLACS